MKTIGLVLHPTNPKAKEVAEAIHLHGASRGLHVVRADEDDRPDAILALGGDGTLLRAAQIAWHLDIPVIGANLGTLGFLATVDAGDVEVMVKSLITDIYRLEERMMVEAVAWQGSTEVCSVMALNEVVVERGTVSRVVKIRVRVGDETVARYVADGFIVATPTGSTAYSLSAGGPVMEPEVHALLLTSVSAHTPLWRSIVVSPKNTVILEIPDDRVAFSADGQPVTILEPGAHVTVRAHERPLKLLTAYQAHFYDKLRSRFHVEPSS